MVERNTTNKLTPPTKVTWSPDKLRNEPKRMANTRTFNFSNTTHEPDTLLLQNANKYVNKVWEDTTTHYNFLKKLGKNNADCYKNSAWCALTVSILAKESGIKLGKDFIPTVDGFISWGGSRYKKIPTTKLNASNVKQERQRRAGEILKQIRSGKMKEGDFIIWKADKALKDGQTWHTKQASHIGIIKSIDPQKGTITVIEGNANNTRYGHDGEALLVKTKAQGIKGNQDIGEVQEVNTHDGIIEKTYTIEQLAMEGYSGYIDNAGIVK